MNTVKFDKRNTLVIAHRGVSGLEVENTNAAFIAAGNRSYYGVETDIHKTADGSFVIFHDGNLLRTAGENISVEEVSLSVLMSVTLFDKDGTKNRPDLRPTTLENYISICKKYEKHCVLELKSEFTDEEIEAIVNIIKGYNYLDEVTFISFKFDNLVKIRKILPTQSVQFLFSEITDEITAAIKEHGFDVDIHYSALNKDVIDDLHGAGIKINCWTVDNKEKAEELSLFGVDYITTNILE